jgi:hypothetical protein
MKDDPLDPDRGQLERQLDEFYRKLDGSARRVEARWKSTPADRSNLVAAWLGAGVAAAAAILLLVSALRTESGRIEEPVVRVAPPAPVTEPAPRPLPAPPAPSPKLAPPTPVETPRAPEAPTPDPPRPETPNAPEPPRATPRPTPETRPEPPRSEGGARTQVVRASVKLPETEGTFELPEKGLRGKQKQVEVFAGDRLRASTLVKITLADDRFVFLAPKSVLEFRPEEKRLSVSLEQGELLADLAGSGPELRVVTKACEIVPQGTVFGVKLDVGRVMVTVEKGRVEVQSARGRVGLRAAEALQASEDGALGTPTPADFRSMAWARSHRAPETTLYSEDFSKPGAWWGEIERGVARAVSKAGAAPTVQITVEKPGLFEVPVRGTLTVLCRSDRAGRFKIQLYSPDLKTTYTKQNIPILRGERWVPLVVDFDELLPSDKSKPARMTPGSTVTDLLLMYGDEPGPGNFWVDAIKVTELRP